MAAPSDLKAALWTSKRMLGASTCTPLTRSETLAREAM